MNIQDANILHEWKDSIDYFCSSKHITSTIVFRYWDLQQLYCRFSIYPTPITLDCKKKYLASKYEGCYASCARNITEKINNHPYIILQGCLLYFDIKIKNATYATLWCGPGNPYDNIPDKLGQGFPLVKINNIFTFPDITIKNPLFISDFSRFVIYTDGDSILYNEGNLNSNIVFKFLELNKFGFVTKLQGRYLVSHAHWPTYSFTEEDIIILRKPNNNYPLSLVPNYTL